MHVGRLRTFRRVIVGLAIAISAGVLASCAPIEGYPPDPATADATQIDLYFKTPPGDGRMQLRNEIVLNRILSYNAAFNQFERDLYGQGNEVTLGSDLAGLVLAGLTATVGGAGTKAALGAASGGILGANTAMNRDLYYNKTIPALLAQMEANRLNVLVSISAGLKLSDDQYPLLRAFVDLDAYKNAGNIPAAITAINQSAGNAKDLANAIIFQRTSAQAQLQGITTVRDQLKNITTDAQFLALAKNMQPFLASRSPEIRKLVQTLDPSDLRLSTKPNAAKKARQVISAWIDNDDVSPVSQQQWLDAIAAAAK